MLVTVVFTFAGCKALRPPGPVIALYEKDGGPSSRKAPGIYDPLVVSKFFRLTRMFCPALSSMVCVRSGSIQSPTKRQPTVSCVRAPLPSRSENSFKQYEESNR